jgi:outer membrane protein
MRILIVLVIAGCARAQQPLHLTLAEAQRLALENHPQLTAAQYAAAAAAEVPKQYRSAYQPVAFANVTGVGADNGSRLAAGVLNNPAVYTRLGLGLTIAQMITDFGRTSNLIAAARLRAEAQGEVTKSTRAQVLLAVSRAYFVVLRARAVSRVADQTVAARQVVSDQVSALAESKLKSTLDVSFANVNLSEAKLLQIQAQNDVKAAEVELATAMGLPNEGGGFDITEEPTPAALSDGVDELVRQALADRSELKERRLQEGAAQRFTKAEHALSFPSLSLMGATGLAPAAVEVVSPKYGAVGVNVNVPIFNGGLYKARQAEAELRARAAAQSISDLKLSIARDIRLAYLNATTAYDRIALARQLLDHAQSALNLAQTRYDVGLGSIVELSQAQLNMTSAQIANSSALYEYQTQRVTLEYQTGALR